MKYKLLVGSHWHQGSLHLQGAVLETDEPLDDIFPGRFDKVSNIIKKVASENKEVTPPPPPAATPPPPPAAPPPKPKRSPQGKAVDGLFDFSPKETGLHVFRRGSRYYVYDADDLETSLNDKGLAKSKVLAFIESQCEE